jgi:rare lipoprotein A
MPSLSAGMPSLHAGSSVLAVRARTTLLVRTATLNVLAGHLAVVAGWLEPNEAGRTVLLQARRRRRWVTLARARTRADGHFRVRYAPNQVFSEVVRLRFAGDPQARPARRSLGRLSSYREAEASWYGGGGTLACGGTLTSSTLGVANKTLPCGTIVTLRYRDRTVRVPVIDRGPYVAGREFDLTEATKRALGFGDLGSVWTTS